MSIIKPGVSIVDGILVTDYNIIEIIGMYQYILLQRIYCNHFKYYKECFTHGYQNLPTIFNEIFKNEDGNYIKFYLIKYYIYIKKNIIISNNYLEENKLNNVNDENSSKYLMSMTPSQNNSHHKSENQSEYNIYHNTYPYFIYFLIDNFKNNDVIYRIYPSYISENKNSDLLWIIICIILITTIVISLYIVYKNKFKMKKKLSFFYFQ